MAHPRHIPLILLAGFLLCAPGDAIGDVAFHPGHEASVVELLKPYTDENLVLEGRSLESLEIGPACEIRLRFGAAAGDDAVTVKLQPADPAAGGVRFLWDPVRPARLGDALEALVRGNIPERFFRHRCLLVSVNDDYSEAETYRFEFLDSFQTARPLLLLEMGLAFALFLVIVARRASRMEWRTVLGGLLLTGLGLGLRVCLVEHATFHENRHEYHFIQGIIEGQTGYLSPCTYFVVMNFLTKIGGATDQAVFLFNALFSALCIPLLGVLVSSLTRSRRAGWAAAAMLAFAPHAIRLAPTATYFNMVSFFFLAAATATIFALRRWRTERRRYHELALAVLLIALSAQCRVLTLAYPAAVVALAYGAGAIRTKQQVQAAVGVCTAVGCLLIPIIISLARLFLGGGSGDLSLENALRSMPHLTLFDRDIVSPTIFPLALLGFVFILRAGRPLGKGLTAGVLLIAALPVSAYVRLLLTTQWSDGFLKAVAILESSPSELLVRAGAVLLIGFLVAFMALWRSAPVMGHQDRRQTAATLFGLLLPLGLAIFVCPHLVSKLRFDLLPNALFTGLAGAGVAGLSGWLGQRSRIAGGAVMILLVGTTLLSYDILYRGFQDTIEYSFLQRQVLPELSRSQERAPTTLVVPNVNEATGVIPAGWWTRNVPGLDVRASTRDVEEGSSPTAVFAFVGPNCFVDFGVFDGQGRFIDEWGSVHSELRPYEPADVLEGRPRLHPNCTAALSGRYWRKVATQELTREQTEGSVASINPSADHIVIGLYRAEE